MNKRFEVRDLVLTAVFAALTSVISMLEIPIHPIPITLGVFITLLSGVFLKPLYAFLSQVIHILLAICGLPVLAGMTGGIGVCFGPTGGYILATPFMALLVSIATNLIIESRHSRYQDNTQDKMRFNKVENSIMGIFLLISIVFCYLFGTMYFCNVTDMNFFSALLVCVIPFIPFDIGKCILVYIILISTDKVYKLR